MSLEICNGMYTHPEIVYESKTQRCPLCAAKEEIISLEKENDRLRTKLEEAEEKIEELETTEEDIYVFC